ncbi:MAG TPA: D-alanyl-D-alanine carboxypeptidase/D-alanyl-D-alanine-endopeptidase [bacterium]|nr:D-alanyl-D-alanine carboxypeptidase/D-alanyl-D-alanine-endopeptidase [bacterium]HPR86780.1 D-alanyl-D-alanine carboxypeptidase/D-alanyl-D-alanine-endopeptidase [bacterium]
MKFSHFSACSLFLLVALASAGMPVSGSQEALVQIRNDLEYIFSDPSFSAAHWGVAVQSTQTGEYFYLRNENKAFMPASNMKLFTTAAALLGLGNDYRFVTRLVAHGLITPDGTLQGDLIIRGCGDPSLSGRWENDKITAVFERWADSLQARKITTVTGKVIGDGRYFNDGRIGTGWAWDDLTDYYSAQISALTFNDNCIDIVFNPGDSLGAPARYTLYPNTAYVQIVNRVKTDQRSRLSFWRDPGSNKIICDGTIGLKSRDRRDWITVENPAKYAATVFREILLSRGIRVIEEAFEIEDLPGYLPVEYKTVQLASHTSPPLSEIVREINKESNNLFAELMLRTVGRELEQDGSAAGGEKAAKGLFEPAGITPEMFYAADGSGLSRQDLVSPMSVIRLLRFMREQTVGQAYFDSLPVAGVDGTLKGRMRGTAAKGNVHAKTGFIGRVRALSGYVTTRDNEVLVFSMIVNNYNVPTGTANHLQDLVCERLANFSRK